MAFMSSNDGVKALFFNVHFTLKAGGRGVMVSVPGFRDKEDNVRYVDLRAVGKAGRMPAT